MQMSRDVLGTISVLSAEQAKTLEQYIHNKYKNYSKEDRTMVFNDAVIKVINKEFKGIELAERDMFETYLIGEAANRLEFFINGYDVVRGITTVEGESAEALQILDQWLGRHIEVEDRLEVLSTLEDYLEISVKPVDLLIEDQNETVQAPLIEEMVDIITPEDVKYLFHRCKKHLVRLRKIRLSRRGKAILLSFMLLSTLLFYPYETAMDSKAISSSRNENQVVESFDVMDIATVEIQFELETVLEEESNIIVSSIPKAVLELNHPLIAYKKIDKEALKKYLSGQDSMLAESPYFEAIIDTAQAYNLNPLLLFAITGQEQGFVAASGRNALRIANNPFNVFGSWTEYNTDIYDATAIASRTIVLLSQGCPEDMNPITWINRKYAEDKNWWVGVTKLLKHIEERVPYSDTV